MNELIYKAEFFRIKKACIEVKSILGNGFLKKVYENALILELNKEGFAIQSQIKLDVNYKNNVVGEYIADIIVDNKIIIELKTTKKITNIHKAQVLNYLKTTGYQLGILINFSPDKIGFEIERIPNSIG